MPEAAPSVGGGAPAGPDLLSHLTRGTRTNAVRFADALLVAAEELDPLGLQDQLDLAAAARGLARCIDEVALPAIRHLHRMLAQGRCDAAQQLLATEAVRTWLARRASFAPPPGETGPIVLACGPRDRDVVGLESLALLLRMQRRACRVLGARTPIFTLTIAARAADAAGVVVVSTEDRNLPLAIAALQAVDTLGIPLFFAGEAFDPAHRRQHLPGRYLGSSVEGGCRHLLQTLAATPRAAAAGL